MSGLGVAGMKCVHRRDSGVSHALQPHAASLAVSARARPLTQMAVTGHGAVGRRTRACVLQRRVVTVVGAYHGGASWRLSCPAFASRTDQTFDSDLAGASLALGALRFRA